ncbi:beta-lactamase [Cytobacillus oceanisediminis]|uniref:Beta-lactamase n=1 Tax=Cytobacillus oceanisediminis TaxID=665099 RepID=A0A2V2ZRT3_9BACI|nr:serine hydrolase [Cytobacillus oceanisediminis]PWW27058.1 beta-lactamase [Cytobacillus oceanisediminis]
MAVKQNLHHYMDSLAANNHFNGAVLVAYKGEVMLKLTAIIEKTSGLSYEQFLQEHILKPLQLKNTGKITTERW